MINTKNWQLAPEADFRAELIRLGLLSPPSTPRLTGESPEKQTEQADLHDLTDALLLKTNVSAESQSIITSYRGVRRKIAAFKASPAESAVDEDPDQREAITPFQKPLNILANL
jgi:hypothetical protein